MLHLDMFVVLMLLGVYNRCWGINKKTILQIPSSLYPTSHVKITNTIIIVPNITRQDYKYHHHCIQHHTSRLQIQTKTQSQDLHQVYSKTTRQFIYTSDNLQYLIFKTISELFNKLASKFPLLKWKTLKTPRKQC
jgi:hypothetical protein